MDRNKARRAVKQLLEAIGEDPSRPDLKATPERAARMWQEVTAGIAADPSREIKVFHYPGFDEIVILKDIPFYSVCEHHLLPFIGKVHLAYIPKNGMITGLSNLIRAVEIMSRRLQVQERLTTELADLLMTRINPRGVLVQIEAEHLCISMRGVKTAGTLTKTEALRGIFRRDERTRAEALSLLKD